MLSDVLENCGIKKFTILGNKLIIRNIFEPKDKEDVKKLSYTKLEFNFLEGVCTKEELPSRTHFIEGAVAGFRVSKNNFIERIDSKFYTNINGRGIKSSLLVVKKLTAESSNLSDMTIRSSDIKVKELALLKNLVVEDSVIVSKNLVLMSVNSLHTKIGAEQLLISGKTRCDKIILEDVISVIILDDFKGVIEFINPVKNLFIDLKYKSKESSDYKVIGHVENLKLSPNDNVQDYENFVAFSDLSWDKVQNESRGTLFAEAMEIETGRTLR